MTKNETEKLRKIINTIHDTMPSFEDENEDFKLAIAELYSFLDNAVQKIRQKNNKRSLSK